MHNSYDFAPCYIEGTLKFATKFCHFEVGAGASGTIACPGEELLYFACDDCQDLFKKPRKQRIVR